MTEYNGIDGLSPREEAVGAILRVGHKGPSGAPVDRDAFEICSRYENDAGIRPQLPSFAGFNHLDKPDRRYFWGNLIHATQAEALIYHLGARRLAGWQYPKMHPNGRHVCSGDGVNATRLYGIGDDGEEDWRDLPCPNDLCEFRLSKECKPWGRLYFMPRWRSSQGWGTPWTKEQGMPPSPVMSWTNGSWNTTLNLLAFFQHVAKFAADAQMDEWTYFGLPFVLELSAKKDKKQGRVFPVTAMSVDGNLAEIFQQQRAALEAAGGSVKQLVADTIEAAVEEVGAAPITVEVPGPQASLLGDDA